MAVGPGGRLVADVAVLGQPGAEVTVYARFPLPHARPSAVLEASILIEPGEAARGRLMVLPVTDRWDERSLTWRTPPRPTATSEWIPLATTSAPLVRLPVRLLVEERLRRSASDLAVALRGDARSEAIPIRLAPRPAVPGSATANDDDDDAARQNAASFGLRLEIYLR